MKKIWQYKFEWILIGLLYGLFAMNSAGNADEHQDRNAQQPPPIILYIPPNRGSPQDRIGGATRGVFDPLQALAPRHVGLTTNTQPRLYWYMASGFRNAQIFRLHPAGSTTTLLEITLAPQINGGIQHLDLAERHIRLTPGQTYIWEIRLKPVSYSDPVRVVSSGSIAVTTSNPQLDRASTSLRPYLAAKQGLWYDALDGVSLLIEHSKNAAYWHSQRANLLEQGGFREAADYDRLQAAER